MTNDELKPRIRTQLMELNRRIAACDWTPDKGYTVKGHMIRYVSGEKIKSTIKPILNDMGLIFDIGIADIQQLPACGTKENHVLIRVFVTLTDAESGEYKTFPVISEGADAGDKAVLAGISYAKRIFWINNFDIIDGMETTEDEGVVSSADVAANILRNALPEKADPPHATGISSPGEGNIAKMQVKAMDNALAVIKKADEEGRIMHEHYEKALEIRQKASCREDVQAILDIRRELGL